MKKMKFVTLPLVMALCISSLSACADNDSMNEGSKQSSINNESNQESTSEESNQQESTGSKIDEEPDSLTVWVPDNIRIEDWDTNAMTVWLEEQGNFELEIVPLASDDYKTKINMSLTAGSIDELPDVILGDFSDSMVWSWAQAETIISLTDYYNDPEMAVNINAAIERTGVDYTQHIVSPDGNIYGVATFNQSYSNEYQSKLWIYEPWLKALGKEVPTTTDEFYEVLKLVSNTDLNGNGKADEIGMLGSTGIYKRYFEVLMNPFVYAGDNRYLTVEDGIIAAAYTTDEWKQGLKYILKLFSEGLILSESLTMSDEQFKTVINSDEPTVFSFVFYNPDMITSGSERKTEYVCIDTLTGPNGVNYASYTSSAASTSFVVTANCKNPEAAFRLGDLMSCEYIGISQRFGEEGVDWDYVSNLSDVSSYTAAVEGFDMTIIMYDDATFWGGSELTNGSWRQTGPLVRDYGIVNGRAMAKDSTDQYKLNCNAAYILYQTSGRAPEEIIPKLVYTQEESDAIGEVESILKTYVNECVGKFVTGSKNIDSEWGSYLEELDKIGLEKYLETVQVVYDRMYK